VGWVCRCVGWSCFPTDPLSAPNHTGPSPRSSYRLFYVPREDSHLNIKKPVREGGKTHSAYSRPQAGARAQTARS